jgi:hypothetical protein
VCVLHHRCHILRICLRFGWWYSDIHARIQVSRLDWTQGLGKLMKPNFSIKIQNFILWKLRQNRSFISDDRCLEDPNHRKLSATWCHHLRVCELKGKVCDAKKICWKVTVLKLSAELFFSFITVLEWDRAEVASFRSFQSCKDWWISSRSN